MNFAYYTLLYFLWFGIAIFLRIEGDKGSAAIALGIGTSIYLIALSIDSEIDKNKSKRRDHARRTDTTSDE